MSLGTQPTAATPGDSELVRAARTGDAISLGMLLERHRPRLYAAALALTGYGPDAEDAVHDTFVTALARLGELRDPGAAGAWLHTILRNTVRMARRQQWRQATPTEAEVCFRELAVEDAVEQRIERWELREWTWAALGQLPEPLRITAMLRYFGSYDSYDELARILGVPVGTVRSRLFEAKVKLADLLLASARQGGDDHARLNAQRYAYYTDAFKSLYRGARDEFLSSYANDMHMIWSSGKTAQGREHFDAEVDDDLATGVQIEPQRVLASGDLTVMEGIFHNPPEDPFHCPPGLAIVFVGDRLVHRVHLHLAPRPPRIEE